MALQILEIRHQTFIQQGVVVRYPPFLCFSLVQISHTFLSFQCRIQSIKKKRMKRELLFPTRYFFPCCYWFIPRYLLFIISFCSNEKVTVAKPVMKPYERYEQYLHDINVAKKVRSLRPPLKELAFNAGSKTDREGLNIYLHLSISPSFLLILPVDPSSLLF